VTGPVTGRRVLRAVARRLVPGRRTLVTGAVAGALVLGSTTAATAYWRAPGTGTGSAASGQVTLTAGAVPASGLYPGASQQVTITVSASAAAGTVTVTSVQPGTAAVSAGAGTCTAAAVTVAVTSPLPAALNGGTVVLTGTVSMATTAEDGCQGRTFTIPLTVNGRV